MHAQMGRGRDVESRTRSAVPKDRNPKNISPISLRVSASRRVFFLCEGPWPAKGHSNTSGWSDCGSATRIATLPAKQVLEQAADELARASRGPAAAARRSLGRP